ncbi:MAG TPA: hypothetical protein VMF67_09235 [Rhizomicrobium sp.]|nr:hypothetical protein [Rhizomicrobium sp.]
MDAPLAASMNVETLGSFPERLIEMDKEDMHAIPLADQAAIQLKGARKRFHELRARIPMLARLAEEQSVTEVRTIEDLAPLLIPHSALKSYPMSYLEKSQFGRLTQWLDGFTTHDLSGVDANACDSIDDWLDLLDAKTEIRVMHSTGTTGKLSFLPRGTLEMHRMVTVWASKFRQYKDEIPLIDRPIEDTPVLYTSYRRGAMAYHRLLDYLESDLYGGDKTKVLASNPGRLSADAASIGGRLRVAESRGELGKIHISPKLLARRDQFLADQKNAGAIADKFLADIAARYRGQTVAVIGAVPTIHYIAVEGLKRGYERLFSPRSYLQLGGGMKGHQLPDDWYDTILRFFGAEKMVEGYGMTELLGAARICPGGHFHLPPWEIPFLLDHATGAQLPRTGTHKGRFGFYDLNTETYWGGFLTGDEVTLSWGDDAPCTCGRVGPYVHRTLRRYAESEGGDDKITCAGAPDAHDKAIEFILQAIG